MKKGHEINNNFSFSYIHNTAKSFRFPDLDTDTVWFSGPDSLPLMLMDTR